MECRVAASQVVRESRRIWYGLQWIISWLRGFWDAHAFRATHSLIIEEKGERVSIIRLFHLKTVADTSVATFDQVVLR